MGLSQQEYWSGLPFPPLGDLPDQIPVSCKVGVFFIIKSPGKPNYTSAAAAAKSLPSCPTLCDPVDGSPPGSLVPGILQARTLERVAISFSNA